MDAHVAETSKVSSSIASHHATQTPFRLYHGTTNSTRPRIHSNNHIIDTSRLTNILSIDNDRLTVVTEPNVAMDALVRHTLAHNLLPLVVMEFPGITAGGGFSGTSGESSSFRHGFFDRTVNWIEMVMGNGETIIARRDDEATRELFWAAASSFGTIGVVTLLEIQCRRVHPGSVVELQYVPAKGMEEALHEIRRATSDPAAEYLDGILFGKDEIGICRGRIVEEMHIPPGTTMQRFTRRGDPWFYMHARKKTKQASSCEKEDDGAVVKDYIPLTDYLFRYDRGGFWVAKYAYAYFMVPFNRITRWLLDWFMHTRVMYHALHESGHAKRYIIQDVAVSYSAAAEFVEWLDCRQNFGYYPIWLCPLRRTGHDDPNEGYGLLAERKQKKHQHPQEDDDDDDDDGNFLLNFGIWAPGPTDTNAFVARNRALERKVDALDGKKWLYAHTYYTEDEFWSMYDKNAYDALRQKYHASYLPSLYDKVKVKIDEQPKSWTQWMYHHVWPVSGLYGVYKAWRGGEYLRSNK